MQPNIVLNWGAICTAIVVAFVFGFLWFGPLFGKTWAELNKFDFSKRPDSKVMMRAMLLQVIGLFLTTFVLAYTTQVWRPSVWGLSGDQADWIYGLCGAVMPWAGFCVPLQFSKVQWEGKPWKLFFLHTVYDLIHLTIIAQILSNWR